MRRFLSNYFDLLLQYFVVLMVDFTARFGTGELSCYCNLGASQFIDNGIRICRYYRCSLIVVMVG